MKQLQHGAQRPKHHPVAALDELGKFFSEEVGIFLGGEVATSCESFVFRMQGPGLFACEDWDCESGCDEVVVET